MNKELQVEKQYGRWTVLDACIKTNRGEIKLLCRCECGTERYVLERSLKYGRSLSCGCYRKERTEQVNAYNLEGKIFGALTVIGKAKNSHKNGGVWWECS